MILVDTDIAPELHIAIDGIRDMTAQLEHLRAVRADYARAFGWARSRKTFAELDRALRRLRKAAR